MRKEVIKTATVEAAVFVSLLGYYAVKVTSGGNIYTPGFMIIGLGFQTILKSVPEKFERLQCW
jgi:hypothetical protein